MNTIFRCQYIMQYETFLDLENTQDYRERRPNWGIRCVTGIPISATQNSQEAQCTCRRYFY